MIVRHRSSLRLGIMSPIVSRNPRHDPPAWEAEGSVSDLVDIARTAERLGYDFMTFPEHVAVPADVAPARGATYWAPAPTMGFIAASTQRLRLATYVLVLAYHHPLELVKTYSTVDRLSSGRVVLGVGVGSLEPEFTLLGAEFAGRGDRADDALRAIRAAWGDPSPTYHGQPYAFEGFEVVPAAPRRDLAIWIGGRTGRSLRRARELGDGWAPFGLLPPRVAELLHTVGPLARPDGSALDLVLAPEPPIDPLGDADGVRATVERYRDVGATHLVFRFRQSSRAHLEDQMAALMALVPEAAVGESAPTGGE